MVLILPIILILGGLLRWYQLAEPSYWMDEGFSIATAQQLLLGDWYIRSPLYHLLLSLVSAISNHVFVLRTLSVIIGLITVWAGYYAAKHWFNQTTAIIFSLLLTTATLEIAWSRQVRMYILLQLFFWLALYVYHQWRQHQLHWVWPALTTLAAIGSHEFGWVLLLIFVWYECLQQFKRFNILIILLSLVLAYTSYHLILPGAPYINYWWQYWYWIITNYGVLLVLAILGIWKSKENKYLVQWLVLSWLSWVWCLSFIVPLLQYRYLFMTFPIILLCVALGVTWLWQRGWIGKCVVGISIGVLIWQGQLTVLPQKFYTLESDEIGSPFSYKSFTPQPNFSAAYDFITTYQQTYPDVRVATPYPDLHRLYTSTEPDYIIFLNLTGGSYHTIPSSYAAPEDVVSGTVMVVDQFAEHRMDRRWLEQPAELLWEDQVGPWSSLSIYRIL